MKRTQEDREKKTQADGSGSVCLSVAKDQEEYTDSTGRSLNSKGYIRVHVIIIL